MARLRYRASATATATPPPPTLRRRVAPSAPDFAGNGVWRLGAVAGSGDLISTRWRRRCVDRHRAVRRLWRRPVIAGRCAPAGPIATRRRDRPHRRLPGFSDAAGRFLRMRDHLAALRGSFAIARRARPDRALRAHRACRRRYGRLGRNGGRRRWKAQNGSLGRRSGARRVGRRRSRLAARGCEGPRPDRVASRLRRFRAAPASSSCRATRRSRWQVCRYDRRRRDRAWSRRLTLSPGASLRPYDGLIGDAGGRPRRQRPSGAALLASPARPRMGRAGRPVSGRDAVHQQCDVPFFDPSSARQVVASRWCERLMKLNARRGRRR